MPPHPQPDTDYDYELEEELAALREWRAHPERAIPERAEGQLLVATWNIANLGVQKRRDKDLALIAEMLGWFDLVAVQEVNDDVGHLREVLQKLPDSYRTLFSAPAGNRERLTFVYDSSKVEPGAKVGSLTIPDTELDEVKLPGVEREFLGFNRHPYVASFHVEDSVFVLVNVHSIFGSEDPIPRRQLETFAIAKWADERHSSEHAYTPNILPLGDFNLPKAETSDEIFAALTSCGLELAPYPTKIGGTNLGGDKQYDQIAFFPGEVSFAQVGVFDFDKTLFRKLWDQGEPKTFLDYVRYYLSDHLPLWVRFEPKAAAARLSNG